MRISVALLLHAGFALGQIVKDLTWTIESYRNVTLDGYTRKAISINGETLGPILHANKGQYLRINTFNFMNDTMTEKETSIHWHGMFMRNNASQDGVAYVTQCPIPPSMTKPYEYTFWPKEQTGTYWYHSHLSDQYCDGLRAPFIIKDPIEAQEYNYTVDDDSTVISIADWYHETSLEAFPPNTDKLQVTPDTILINKRGRYGMAPKGCTQDDGCPQPDLSVFNITWGSRARYRVINTSCLAAVRFSIDGHKLTVIEADGILKEETVTESFDLFPGQRVSFVLDANQEKNNYWIRTLPLSSMSYSYDNGTNPAFPDEKGVHLAILRYDGAEKGFPTTLAKDRTVLKEWELKDRKKIKAETKNVKEFYIQFESNKSTHVFDMWVNRSKNSTSWAPPSVAVLLQILKNDVTLVPSESLLSINHGDVVRVTFNHYAPYIFAHPFHLHGHSFQVIQAAGQKDPNYDDPPLRDVLPIWAEDKKNPQNITIQFVADNPGPWIMHCHIDWHLSKGLALVFVEDRARTVNLPVPYKWKQLCDDWEAYKKGQYRADDPIHWDLDSSDIGVGRQARLTGVNETIMG